MEKVMFVQKGSCEEIHGEPKKYHVNVIKYVVNRITNAIKKLLHWNIQYGFAVI
jgi:sugar-specific transcriptional regulator TrmB